MKSNAAATRPSSFPFWTAGAVVALAVNLRAPLTTVGPLVANERPHVPNESPYAAVNGRRALDLFAFFGSIYFSARHVGFLSAPLFFILIRREDSHFNEAKRSKWEMNRLNYILLKIG